MKTKLRALPWPTANDSQNRTSLRQLHSDPEKSEVSTYVTVMDSPDQHDPELGNLGEYQAWWIDGVGPHVFCEHHSSFIVFYGWPLPR